jgi:hypothetical protein
MPLRKGGLGVVSVELIHEAAFLGSIKAVNDTENLLQGGFESVGRVQDVMSAIANFNEKIHSDDQLNEQTFKYKKFSQKTLSELLHNRSYNLMMMENDETILDTIDKIRIKEMSKASTGAWMSPLFPNWGRNKLLLTSYEFILLVKRNVGFKFFEGNIISHCYFRHQVGAISSLGCMENMDGRLLHATDLCRKIYNWRHNETVRTVAHIANMAGFSTSKEIKCIPGSNKRPADILMHNGPNEVQVAIDVAVSSPFTQAHVKTFDPMEDADTTTNDREREKMKKYGALFKESSIPTNFIPYVITTFGGKNQKSRELNGVLAGRLSERWTIKFYDALKYVNGWLVGTLMKETAGNMIRALGVLQNVLHVEEAI